LTLAGGAGSDAGTPAGGPRFTADLDAVMAANRELATEVLIIQATGDYDRAGSFIERYGAIPEEMRAALDRLGEVPVDIRPRFAVRNRMADWR